MAFIECALWRELQNDLAKGNDRYPKSLSHANTLLQRWTDANGAQRRQNSSRNRSENVSFYQQRNNNQQRNTGQTLAGSDGVTHTHVTCYACGARGHYAPQCPDVSIPNLQGMQDLSFSQEIRNRAILKSWILLDKGSTFNSFCNRLLLANICACDVVRANSNGGQSIILIRET